MRDLSGAGFGITRIDSSRSDSSPAAVPRGTFTADPVRMPLASDGETLFDRTGGPFRAKIAEK
ncbi:hypothetical protein [Nocardia sp. NPDC057668]|uniref:hypothetical protein n=1 Tax=Nocardia sp. NPDC057668 TaxID=3346202 RepID=UPI003672A4A0